MNANAAPADPLDQKTDKPLRVAVTGGSGRIGRNVVKLFVARGHSVINLDRHVPGDSPGRFVYADLRHREVVQPIFEQVDAVCHLGEIPGLGGSSSPDEVYAHNTQIGAVVLQAAADLKLKRVVYTSTCQVYGCWGPSFIAPVRLPMDESHPLQPQNAYAMGKVANEGYAAMVAQQHGLSVAIFRFPAVFEWDVTGKDEKHFMHWIRHATAEAEGFGTYLHCADAARAFLLAIENPRPGCEAYHFVAREVITAVPIAERLRKVYPNYPPLPADWPPFATPALTTKAKAHFGWEPRHSLLDLYRLKTGHDPRPDDAA